MRGSLLEPQRDVIGWRKIAAARRLSQSPSARGGPGTARGHIYQINCAIFRSLELVVQYFAAPHKPWALTLEPRIIHPSEAVTRWDISTEPQTVLWEAKVELTKLDIEEWLHRIRDAKTTDGIRFGLVYGDTRTPILREINRLRKIALECGSDQTKFHKLSAEVGNATWIISALGPLAVCSLQRMQIEQYPEEVLHRDLEFRAQHLAGAAWSRLLEKLFHRFSTGSASRVKYDINDLINYYHAEGIHLTSPGDITFSEVPSLTRRAAIALKACQHGIPKEVLAAALNSTVDLMNEALNPLIAQKIVVDQKHIWRLATWSHSFSSDESLEILTACFDHLLDWLPNHETDPTAIGQLYNAMDIAPGCLRRHPGLALKFFQSTEHIIKNLGDKHRLLEMSELCIEAAKDPSNQDKDLKAKAMAQAYMCGHSWVFQRIGRLDEARTYAQKSLQLGENIRWDRNTAFVKKCIGRLNRITAEACLSVSEKGRLFEESKANLRQAIELFGSTKEFGPSHRQVGDCYSLLGRTQLVSGDLSAARESVRKAYDILPKGSTKEYLDLLILSGDIEAKKNNRENAEHYYQEVIESKSNGTREISEIHARAYFQRGRNRANRGEKYVDGAKNDFDKAISIWQSLGEHEEAAKAHLLLMRLCRVVDEKILKMFDAGDSHLTVVTALQGYLERLSEVKAHAHRAEPTSSQIDEMLKEARRKVAEEHPEW
jgi:tetratricopeptide (TPR) repeat protein